MANPNGAAPEQFRYIPCKFCNMILSVSIPCRDIFDVVSVRCGHCTNIWSENIAASFHSMSAKDVQVSNQSSSVFRFDSGSSSKYMSKPSNRAPTTTVTQERVVNQPPQKRHRAPSLYNQFIKEEIQRIKVNNPEISHREAFSAAAKNWARVPHIHFGLMLETSANSTKLDDVSAIAVK
nr:YABBY8 protein [Averrhoa carambola]